MKSPSDRGSGGVTVPAGVVIRPEHAADIADVATVNRSAFGRDDEALLVDRLRATVTPFVSLIALLGTRTVGHICFSPVSIERSGGELWMGLAPMAVLPPHQRTGIGGTLVRTGLAACRSLGAGGAVVLGHADYYPRFGFVTAARVGLRCEYEVPDDAFMALELTPGAMARAGGLVRYAPAFAAL